MHSEKVICVTEKHCSSAMSDYTPVVKSLGRCAFDLIHDRAVTMRTTELHEFALQIGTVSDGPNRVLGNFQRRDDRQGSTLDAAAHMRAILTDWHSVELYDLTRDQALKKLINVKK